MTSAMSLKVVYVPNISLHHIGPTWYSLYVYRDYAT